MSRADYFAAVHAAFDARRDPLDDAAVRDWLAAHPEDLPEFAAMRAALAPAGVRLLVLPPPRRVLWPLVLPPLAAAAALLLFLRADRPPAPLARPAPMGAILAIGQSSSVQPAAQFLAPASGATLLATSVTSTRTGSF